MYPLLLAAFDTILPISAISVERCGKYITSHHTDLILTYFFIKRDVSQESVTMPYNDRAWSDCIKAVSEYDASMIQGWNEDIDNLLVLVRER